MPIPVPKNLVIDIDDTLTINDSSASYATKQARSEVVSRLNEYKLKGYRIVLYTARNMYTYNGDLEKIRLNTLPVLIDWLKQNSIYYDEIIIGKPWCGTGFYVDDKAIRPDEFINFSEEEIFKLIK